MEVVDTANPHLFGFVRQNAGQRLLIVANFSEHPRGWTPTACACSG